MGELKQDVGEAGQVVGIARNEVEKRLGEPIVTDKLPNGEYLKRISKKN